MEHRADEAQQCLLCDENDHARGISGLGWLGIALVVWACGWALVTYGAIVVRPWLANSWRYLIG